MNFHERFARFQKTMNNDTNESMIEKLAVVINKRDAWKREHRQISQEIRELFFSDFFLVFEIERFAAYRMIHVNFRLVTYALWRMRQFNS